MNINFTNKLFILIVFLTFAAEHSLLFSVGCIIYFTLQNITRQELEMLNNAVSNQKTFLSNLKKDSLNIGITAKSGRQIIANYWDSLLSKLSPEQIQQVEHDSTLQNKLEDTLESHFNPVQNEWVEYSLQQLYNQEEIFDDELDFIKYFIPDVDLDCTLNRKAYTRLFKQLKAAMRNSDGSIKNEAGQTCLELVDYLLRLHFEPQTDYAFGDLSSKEEEYALLTSKAWLLK